LALDAERAGSAWACAYSSSEEFEAAIIQARRQAGAYGATNHRKRVYWGCAAGALILLLLVLV
jgi:hypothetical protein